MTAKWDVFELRLNGEHIDKPYVNAELSAEFTHENRTVYAEGFYDGNDEYVIRFMPDTEGLWSYITKSNVPNMSGLTGEFTCATAKEGVHGRVRANRTRLLYEDGASYSCVGTTCYCWTHQGDALEETTLATLSKGYFNKIRMCVFPKHYEFNSNEPEYYPFAGGKTDGGYEWNYEEVNPEFWRHFEKRVGQLMEMDIQADIILFHPYDRWGFSKMPHETDLRYLRYAVARLSAFRNVWWSFANEYDLMREKTMNDWDEFFKLVQEKDPYGHLRSIHNCRGFYDYSKPWVTHCSIQHSDMEKVPEWISTYKKPVVIDECCYEGDIPNYWGSIPAVEMVDRMWNGFTKGGYVGHGETYLCDNDVLWWAKGGVLRGQSPERILFLKKIIESLPCEPTQAYERTRVMGLRCGDEKFIYYYGIRQSKEKYFDLPEGKKYRAEIFDAWNMTVTELEGVFEGNRARVPMPARSYCGIMFTSI